MRGEFVKGKWLPVVYVHPSDKEGHTCFECAFNIVDLDDYDSRICCNPLSPYHCIDTFEPINCDKHATRGELYDFYNRRLFEGVNNDNI